MCRESLRNKRQLSPLMDAGEQSPNPCKQIEAAVAVKWPKLDL